MRYGTDKSDSSNRYRGGAISPSSYQNNSSSHHYHSNYDYKPPTVTGTYAQQQTHVLEDTMRTHYETETTAGNVLNQMQNQRQQLQGAQGNVWEMRQSAEKAKRDITNMVKKARQKKLKLQMIAIALALVDFFLLVRLLQCGGSFFCKRKYNNSSSSSSNYNGNYDNGNYNNGYYGDKNN